MNKYKASVKVGGLVINTIVFSDNANNASLLLRKLYGSDNLISYPVKVG
jgi:hypothetical protein